MVSEVEGRIKDRDEQQHQHLDYELNELKQMVSAGLASMSLPARSSDGLSEPRTLPVPAHSSSHDIPSASDDASLLGTPVLADNPMAAVPSSTETISRDACYAGVAGALLGAAVITVWDALLR